MPRNDPTLMFTNAGMVQFKNVFTGQEKRPYPRAATSQKCVRAGGKHNDLDNVGYTARHHTFFEMLGNFSFGDYFKEHAIELAWKLLTRDFGLPQGPAAGHRLCRRRRGARPLEEDRRPARRRIIRIAGSDNFWAMGDTGPCGPCSEIFYDHGDEHSRRAARQRRRRRRPLHRDLEPRVHAVRAACRAASAIDLPRPSIDTGMGLERIAAVLQGMHDNYDDRSVPRADRAPSAELTGVEPDGAANAPATASSPTICAPSRFLIADGVLPSNEGRGYVLRRIMRRAMRHAQLLGASEPLMWRLVPTLVARDGPGLSRARSAPRR